MSGVGVYCCLEPSSTGESSQYLKGQSVTGVERDNNEVITPVYDRYLDFYFVLI